LCCNGALFNRVPTKEHERARLLAIGFKLRPFGDKVVFDQPCQMLDGRCCSVYEDRPQTCSRFRCLLLRAHEAGELSRNDALHRIEEAKRLLDEVAPFLPADQSIADARVTWRNRMRGASPMEVPGDRDFLLRMLMFSRYLDTHFLREDEKTFETPDVEKRSEPPPAT
jgi:hypothetical protein